MAVMLENEYLEALLEEKHDDIEYLKSVIRELYAEAGEDENIARICNQVLENPRFCG